MPRLNMTDLINSYESGQRSNYYDMQNQLVQDKLNEETMARRARSLYDMTGGNASDYEQALRDNDIPATVGYAVRNQDPRFQAKRQALSNAVIMAVTAPTEQEFQDTKLALFRNARARGQDLSEYGLNSEDDVMKLSRADMASLIADPKAIENLATQRMRLLARQKPDKDVEVLNNPQLYSNPDTGRNEMWYFDKMGKPRSFVRLATQRDIEGGTPASRTKAAKAGDKEEKLGEILGPYKSWATQEPDKWAMATDIASEGVDKGLGKFEIQKLIGQKINEADQAQLEEMRAKKRSGGWKDFVSGLFGNKAGAESKLKRTGNRAKNAQGLIIYEMSDGTWQDANGKVYK